MFDGCTEYFKMTKSIRAMAGDISSSATNANYFTGSSTYSAITKAVKNNSPKPVPVTLLIPGTVYTDSTGYSYNPVFTRNVDPNLYNKKAKIVTAQNGQLAERYREFIVSFRMLSLDMLSSSKGTRNMWIVDRQNIPRKNKIDNKKATSQRSVAYTVLRQNRDGTYDLVENNVVNGKANMKLFDPFAIYDNKGLNTFSARAMEKHKVMRGSIPNQIVRVSKDEVVLDGKVYKKVKVKVKSTLPPFPKTYLNEF